MVKIKYFSVYSDFKTSFFAKLLFFLTAIFILLYFIIILFDFFFHHVSNGVIGFIVSLAESSVVDISLAMIILCAGLGIIALFFHHQFKKLSTIADELKEIEQLED